MIQHRHHVVHTADKKVHVFKNKEDQTRGNDADHQINCFRRSARFLNFYSGDIIDENRDQKDKDVFRHKRHVKKTAGREQHLPKRRWAEKSDRRTN
jgi:hypothetical protein